MEGDTCIVPNTALPLDHPVQKTTPKQTADLQGRSISPGGVEGVDANRNNPCIANLWTKRRKNLFQKLIC